MQRPTSRVLEGREPRHLRRRELGALAGRLDHRRTAGGRPAARAPQDAGDQGLDPQPAHRPVHHRRLRARRRHPAPDDLPTLDGLYVAPRTLRRGDAYTATVYTPRPTENQRRRAGVGLPGRACTNYTTIDTSRGGRSRAPRASLTSSRSSAPSPDDPHARTARAATPRDLIQRAGIARTYALARAAGRRRAHPRGLRPARARLPRSRDEFTYSETPPPEASHARRLPVRRQAGLLPAVLGRDGAAAAHGRHPRARGHRLLHRRDRHQDRRVRRARLRRALLGRGLLPRLGLDHVRPDARRLARPQPARRRRQHLAAASAPAAAPTSAATRSSERGAGVAGRGRAAPWWHSGDRRRRARRWPALVAASRVRRWRRGAPPALSELERALKRTRREPAPGTTLHALELRFADTPAAAGYVRALRESRYRDAPAPPDPRPAPRPAVRARTRRRLLGRLRAWWALPPR